MFANMFKALIPEPECPVCGTKMKNSSGSRIMSVIYRTRRGPFGGSGRFGTYCPQCGYREPGLF